MPGFDLYLYHFTYFFGCGILSMLNTGFLIQRKNWCEAKKFNWGSLAEEEAVSTLEINTTHDALRSLDESLTTKKQC